ncbi:transposable element Tcb2 transposase [Trichonephila clavipes]|nr:transposable element Tcb2 transposase [Trichonephila clavipes]
MSTMSHRSHLTDSEAWRVVGRLEGGQTQDEVAQAIGVSQSLYARRPMVCVKLTSRHRRNSREWATEHVNWRRNEWSNVPFSDESCFSVHPDNRRIFIWRDRDSRNNPAFVHENDALGRRVAGRQPPPQTLQELERALLEEWDRIP